MSKLSDLSKSPPDEKSAVRAKDSMSLSVQTLRGTPFHPFPKHLRFQKSLLVLIDLHLLRRFFRSVFDVNNDDPSRLLPALKQCLQSFFEKVGYVSHCFLESACLAVTVFFKQTRFL
ncbi:hypothetical protein GEMRC1_013658 [Eukaryota sp. GEM-RC1]